jgi:hypothetical protein
MYQAFGLLHTALQMHQVGILLEDVFLLLKTSLIKAFGLLHTALQMHQVGILLEDFFS